MGSRDRRRVTLALVASALIHLLLLAAYLRMADWYRRQELRPTRYLPDLLLLAPDLFRQQPVTRIPERLLEKVEAAAEPSPLPAPELPSPPPLDLRDSTLVASGLDTTLDIGVRPLVFIAEPETGDADLNKRQIEAVRKLREERDTYARFWLPDADTSDAAGRSQTRAEAVVARAFEAMGGLDELLAIRQMRAVVWLVAFQTLRGEGRQARLDTVAPFAYPIATWHMHGQDHFDREAFRVDFDLASGDPFPSYLTKNPAPSRQAYYRLFDARWRLFAPVTTRPRRLRSEKARWHFCDWFLGEGIRLSYAGSGRLDGAGGPVVERIEVDDRKFGRRLEAFFDRDTGLLLATRERLLASEAEWFQQRTARSAPVWTTTFSDYRPVGQVLLPHRWQRAAATSVAAARSVSRRGSATMGPMALTRIDLRLNIAINDAHPDTVAPEL